MRLFKPQFAAMVENGTKLQTVRPVPKRMPRPGDRLSLRCWVGAPYRSKQRVLREAVVAKVERIVIGSYGTLPICVIPISDAVLNYWPDPTPFARADGFSDWPAMRAWFEQTHGLPFEGVLISWHNVRISDGANVDEPV